MVCFSSLVLQVWYGIKNGFGIKKGTILFQHNFRANVNDLCKTWNWFGKTVANTNTKAMASVNLPNNYNIDWIIPFKIFE